MCYRPQNHDQSPQDTVIDMIVVNHTYIRKEQLAVNKQQRKTYGARYKVIRCFSQLSLSGSNVVNDDDGDVDDRACPFSDELPLSMSSATSKESSVSLSLSISNGVVVSPLSTEVLLLSMELGISNLFLCTMIESALERLHVKLAD